jgi:hypothetical protein
MGPGGHHTWPVNQEAAMTPVSAAITGIEGHLIQVQATAANGPPGLHITGLPDGTVRETRDRVNAAVRSLSSRRVEIFEDLLSVCRDGGLQTATVRFASLGRVCLAAERRHDS